MSPAVQLQLPPGPVELVPGSRSDPHTAPRIRLPLAAFQKLIEQRLDTVAARTKELRHLQKVLNSSLQTCRKHAKSGRCGVIDMISASAQARRL